MRPPCREERGTDCDKKFLYAGVILTGAIQLVCGVLRLGKFIRLVPKPVMLGFVNGLALVIGIAQFEQFRVGHAWLQGAELYTMCGLVAAMHETVTVKVRAPGSSIG